MSEQKIVQCTACQKNVKVSSGDYVYKCGSCGFMFRVKTRRLVGGVDIDAPAPAPAERQTKQKKSKEKSNKADKIKRAIQAHLTEIIIAIFLSIYAISLILLMGWGLLSSFKSPDDFGFNGNILGLPDMSIPGAYDALAFGNYTKILFGPSFKFSSMNASYYSSIFGYIENAPDTTFTFGHFIFNSVMYSIICSFVHAFIAFTCAYLCAKYKFRFSKIMYVVMLIVMAIPIVGSSPSMLTVLRDLGIYDTIFAMIALNFNFTGVYFFVFHAHFEGLSDTYMEAAEIDGASQIGVFFTIIFPLCIKVFFTVFLLQFIATWNDYQTPLLYYPNHPTLAYAVFKMLRDTGGSMDTQNVPTRVAGCMVLAVPILIVFVSCNKLLMGNLTMGGLKE